MTDTLVAAEPLAPQQSDRLVRRDAPPPQAWSWEPSARWVRGYLDEVALVDSRRPILVWEPGAKVPEYGFPVEDVRTDLLVEGEAPDGAGYYRPKGTARRWFDAVIDGHRVPAVAWTWNADEFEGFLAVTWFPGILDRWTEEDEPVFAHPRDPHNRVDTLASSRHIVVTDGDRRIAESDAAVIVYETGLPPRYYLPRDDVDWTQLVPIDSWSECPYKGRATDYWASVEQPDREIAWSYPDPLAVVAPLAGRIAFYSERVSVLVDGIAVGRPVTTRDAR